jgi:quercetin dioxygenase-like cupin family protein
LINATLRPTDHAPELVYPSGGQVRYLTTGASTGGGFGLYRWEMAAAPSGPEPHFHKTISESFYLLTGAVRLYDGKQWVEGGPGDFLCSSPRAVFTRSATSPASPRRC